MLWNPVFYRLWGSEKKYIKGIFFTEWILMILCTVIASVLGFNEVNGQTFELISWLLIGAASGQYVSGRLLAKEKNQLLLP